MWFRGSEKECYLCMWFTKTQISNKTSVRRLQEKRTPLQQDWAILEKSYFDIFFFLSVNIESIYTYVPNFITFTAVWREGEWVESQQWLGINLREVGFTTWTVLCVNLTDVSCHFFKNHTNGSAWHWIGGCLEEVSKTNRQKLLYQDCCFNTKLILLTRIGHKLMTSGV